MESSHNHPHGIKFYHTQHFPQTGQNKLTNREVSAIWVWINWEARSELKKNFGSKLECEKREMINKG